MIPAELPQVYIALPVLNEYENLPEFLTHVRNQSYPGTIRLFVCVNQPDEWWNNPAKMLACQNNASSLALLHGTTDLKITVIDRSTKGLGWKGRKHGVGFSRREVMEAIAREASGRDILISLDADTAFSTGYISSVVSTLMANPQASALAVPYYHRLTGTEVIDRAMLRYEIYMRSYSLNMLRIASPYAFTALGSAIALTVKNYKSIGGITPKLSGEDFYFLQKLRKRGKIITRNPEKVYPASRFSDRVYFGTGPAMIKGAAGDWSSYPVYHYSLFDEVKKTYDRFPYLFIKNITTPMDEFLEEIFPGEPTWDKLRANSTSVEKFVWACHQKVDGLRVLQFLKWRQRKSPVNDERNLMDFLETFFPDCNLVAKFTQTQLNFSTTPVVLLNQTRDFLVEKEDAMHEGR